ncbi:MAG: UDP-N-acetylmuramate:L-alanyl-gamma-D-glutamyl-meso-diaminopimelate ligase [Gammaproteobacteria bacterium]|nr:UDP-N-acetylmuramate:L-alanyl-gamma-D-glutamyl-meso-diaminopimelate ligase [Gammaproteobacteria bacterium]
MHIHILGICGTFMGGIAALAKQAGHEVTGSDAGVYPPMSDQLATLGILVREGYEPSHLRPQPDCVVIGNVMSRGNPVVEEILNRGLPYRSGPQWLADHILQDKWVLAVAGTHGKTTTSSMLAWILDYAGLEPGFLIGGVPANFGQSARSTAGNFFVVEADEYDTAFFDKRSKFVHYRPRTVVLNNLEYDHADIFADLNAIKQQFHQLLRTVPGEGRVIYPARDKNIADVIAKGCWTPLEGFSLPPSGKAGVQHADWQACNVRDGGRAFDISYQGQVRGAVNWTLGGLHNVSNALAAVAAARHAGVPVNTSLEALGEFSGVARRMQLLANKNGVRIYDDFAHHPTAIASTLRGMRASHPQGRLIAIIEPRSNTMKMGIHNAVLPEALADADQVYVYAGESLTWNPAQALSGLGDKVVVRDKTSLIVAEVLAGLRSGDDVVIMSNGGFEGLPARLAGAIDARACGAD